MHPKRPGYRSRIEGALSSWQRLALKEACTDLGVSITQWREVPGLGTTFELVAVEREARKLERADWPPNRAFREACARLGLDRDVMRKRRDRLAERLSGRNVHLRAVA